ncbi:cytochrome d ubiquinol oxidase subunit II [Salinibius halmophilus]|uniref:cytochrome d ubiquinol oxidase subunit II n=1 Tax=Salinibius halmophilus TaxID=1853216 RepID=UPI000E668CFA|nr:cytochrome d ubiquinol oxidase subunit II [Salinibius halmophilus]
MFEQAEQWLPMVFMALMGLSFLVYAILDGYDLGVGILMPDGNKAQRDTMIASIGPFWDANETWLVLAAGLLLVAFPFAHGIILTELYIPVTVMIVGLIARGVAYDFRAKAKTNHQLAWDRTFKVGSIVAAAAQGYMIGMYVAGFEQSLVGYGFAVLGALGVVSAYTFIGACWLVMKTDGELQLRSARWARRTGWITGVGVILVSLANVFFSPEIAQKWFSMPSLFILLPLPVISLMLFVLVDRYLAKFPYQNDFGYRLPFFAAAGIFFIAAQGLAYSYFPWLIPGEMDIWQAAAPTQALQVMFIGALFVLPVIVAYTIFMYRVFGGKTQPLNYDLKKQN